MTILFSTPRGGSAIGGAESVVSDLVAELTARGHRVHVVTGIASTVRALLTVRRIDVVCVGLVGRELFPLLWCRRFRRFRLAVYLHGGELRSYARVSRPMRRALGRALRTCDVAIAVSEALAAEAARFEPQVGARVIVLRNAVNVAMFRDAQPLRRQRPFVLFAGRLHPVKGVSALIDAFAGVAHERPELDLVIAGDGPLARACQDQIAARGLASRVHLRGAQPRAQVAALLKGCEFAILPSRAEGCPVFVLEAQAAGRLIIATRVKGTVEMIEDGVTGELVEPDSVAALSDRIRLHAADRGRRREIERRLSDRTPVDLHDACTAHLRAYLGELTPLSLCVVSSFFEHDRANSGLSSYYFTLCRSLLALGHEVRLVTSPENREAAVAAGIPVTSVRTRLSALLQPRADRRRGGARRAVARFRFAWEAWRVVRRRHRESRVDFVIAPELFAPGLLISLAMRRKLVTRLHTPTVFGDRYNGAPIASVASRIAGWPERVQAFRSRALSAASRHLIQAIAEEWRLPASRVTLLPNSIDIDHTRELSEKGPREIFGDYLLYFGRLERRKGVHVLTAALADVFATDPAVRAVYIGNDWGLKADILQSPAFATGRLEILETMSRARILSAVRHARLVVLPSLFENVSNAALESMALARPLIGTRRTAFEELIDDGVDGFLVDPGDAIALARTITQCLKRPDLNLIGDRALERVRQYDGPTIARAHDAFLRSVLAPPGTA